MFKKYQGKTYCFSPPVMLATLVIEFSIAIYAIWRYKMNKIGKLIVIMLCALGTFQLSEYLLCGGMGLSNVEWARIGYMAITLLPPLGIHIIIETVGKKKPILLGAAYASCVAFIGFYLFASSSVTLLECMPNYAVFSAYPAIALPFSIYYFVWILAGIYLAVRWRNEMPKYKKPLQAMAIGYLAFVLPTAIVNIVYPSTISGIPSIMCGFAVILAITAIKVLPSCCETRDSIQGLSDNTQTAK